MIEEEKIFCLTGWIRLVHGDGFGIALFNAGENATYIAETDNNLAITCFHVFYNEEGYEIDYDLPANHKNRIYSIGDGGPIPFSAGGLSSIADIHAGSEALLKAYDAQIDEGVVGTVARVILQAETGAFERENLDRWIRNFERRYRTVFLEGSVHARYWIEQYQRAARELSVVSANERLVLWERLRLLGSDWLGKHFSSGDIRLNFQMLKIIEIYQILSSEEIKYRHYEFFVSRIQRQEFFGIMDPVNTIVDKIPEGLYYYEIPIDVNSLFYRDIKSDLNINLILVINGVLSDAEKNREFKIALELAKSLFGDHGLPSSLHERVLQISSRFVKIIEQGANSYRGHPPKDLKKSLISAYRALQSIRQLLNWKAKAVPGPMDLGLSEEATWLLDQWLKLGEIK